MPCPERNDRVPPDDFIIHCTSPLLVCFLWVGGVLPFQNVRLKLCRKWMGLSYIIPLIPRWVLRFLLPRIGSDRLLVWWPNKIYNTIQCPPRRHSKPVGWQVRPHPAGSPHCAGVSLFAGHVSSQNTSTPTNNGNRNQKTNTEKNL